MDALLKLVAARLARFPRLMAQAGFGWRRSTVVAALSVAVGAGLWACFPLQTVPLGPTTVRGYIAVAVGGETGANKIAPREEIYLPSIEVVLRRAGTSEDSPPSITDLSGRFTTQVKSAGRYQVCWRGEGFGSGCLDKLVALSGKYRNISTVLIPLPPGQTVAAYGTVRLADGGSPRAFDALANINSFARVALLEAPRGSPKLEVAVNNNDQYVLPGIERGRVYTVRIRQEGYLNEQGLQIEGGQQAQRLNFTVVNHAPALEPLLARDAAGVRVGTAAPGSTVGLLARVSDREGDPLRYLWRVSAGTLSSATDRNPTWTLPDRTGRHAANLITYDGRGGYAAGRVGVTIDPRGLEFSGRVTGTDAPVLVGATVDVNGVAATTDASGFFRLFVPDTRRFVLTIRKPGYGFASVIYYDGVMGGSWQLVRASVQKVDPTRDIEVTNRRKRDDCPGAPSARMDWRGHPQLAQPRHQDGRGNFITAPKEIAALPGLPGQADQRKRERECERGISVQIPANGLVDAGGNPPAGPVSVQLSTIDLASGNQMPGNYSVVQGSGVGVMQSYGAGIVEVYAGATRYNLKPGVQARVVIPVDPVQLAAGAPIPPTIPLLRYNEQKGVWEPDGTLSLDNVAGAPAYVAKVSQFSALNSDLIKTDQSCLAVQNEDMPANYDLEVTIPQPTGPVTRLFTSVAGVNVEHVLLNLPKNTNIVLVPIRTTDSDPLKNQLPMGVFTVNTGAPQNPALPTVPGGFANEPEAPYYSTDASGNPDGACSTRVVIKDLGTNFYPNPASLLTGAFLHGLQAFAAVNLSATDAGFPGDAGEPLRSAVEAASQAYREAIDPNSLRSSLACFKRTNGFALKADESCAAVLGFTTPAVLPETAAAYANTIDLGFGREMHCVQSGGNAACYVSNYDSLAYTGPGDASDTAKADHAVDGLNGVLAPDATVAMEFSAIEDFKTTPGTPAPIVTSDPQRTVKFYVYNGAGVPVDKANLDGLGDRPVPQLCMACHGGFIPNPTGSTQTTAGVKTPVFRSPVLDGPGSRADVRLGAKFLPFDLHGLTFPTAAGFDRASQEAAFKTLNQIAKAAPPPDADPTSNVIQALYDTWYPGDATPQQNAVVPLWNADGQQRAVYSSAIASSCRTCHVANPEPLLRFDSASNFNGQLGPVQSRVCKEHVMPHARRTHDLFWASTNPSQPAQLQVYGDAVKAANPAVGWQIVGNPGVSTDLICGNEYTQGGDAIVTAFTPVSLIFSGNCIGCHSDAAVTSNAFAFLGLSADAHAHIVNVDSHELPSMKRIKPNDTVNSYLLRKLQGTHAGLGAYQAPGPGVRMPQNSPFLDAAQINTISGWINSGAPND